MEIGDENREERNERHPKADGVIIDGVGGGGGGGVAKGLRTILARRGYCSVSSLTGDFHPIGKV